MLEPLVPDRDYILDTAGRFIFTREYLLARGECCGSDCQNCPYNQPPTAAPGAAPADFSDASRFDAHNRKR